MLLTLTTTHTPATDLGYLLYKHPDRVQSWDLNWGVATVFYPEATPERCTAALLLDIDPVGLVRRDEGEGFALQQYVNDRPYVASSFFAVAMAQVLRNAMSGECKERPTLAATPIPLVATLAALPCRGGPALIERLFAPLGYTLQIEAPALDETRPDWGAARVAKVTLSATVRLSALLNHLYVLIPVLDAEKHYWVDREEAEKLLRHGQGWLEHHPERTLITERFLGKAARSLSREVLSRLAGEGVVEADPEAEEIERGRGESAMERPLSLDQRRIAAVREALLAAGARSVIDMGCGEGKLLKALVQEPRFTRLTGVDVSVRTLQITARRLDLERIEDREPGRLRLLQGSAPYRDPRLEGADALVMVSLPRSSGRSARPRSSSPRPTSSTTRSSPASLRARSATETTASSGPAPSSRPGVKGAARSTATPSPTPASVRPTPSSAPRPRWRCSPDAPEPPRALPRPPRRALRRRKIDPRAAPLQGLRGRVERRLSRDAGR
jgi:3' terminal RNA ribose 2'-O-methyltransferase Hen1